MSECLLRTANGRPNVECQEQRCMFWRLIEHVDLPTEPGWTGCAIQHFDLLEGGEPVAAWLLSVKERLEDVSEEMVVSAPPSEVLDPRD